MNWKHSILPVSLAAVVLLTFISAAENGQRKRREVSSLLSDLAGQFFNRGGSQGVSELNDSEDKMGVLKRYLGSALVGAMFGNGDDLISRILGSFSGGSSSSRNNNANSGTGTYSGTGSGSTGYKPPGNNNADSSPPLTNSKTGVSIVNSRPGDRSPSTNSNSGFDSSRRGSSGNFDGDNSSTRRGSGSAGSRNGGTDFVPQSGSSSKTGVSIVNSRPDDRPRGTNSNSGGRVNPNNNVNGAVESSDYEAEGPFNPTNTGNGRGSASGDRVDPLNSGYGRYSGNRRGSDSGEISSGRRTGAGSRAVPSTGDADSY